MLELILYGLYVVLTLISIFIAWKLMFAFKHFRMKPLLSVPDVLKNRPSVSVCIPARNEMHAMTQCLERVIASKYPKLEIIVLDDSSIDNTSVLIKSFAHAGVRFVEGSDLPEGWLGKNHALQGLLDEASGSYIFFMDVDTYIQPDTIGRLMSYIAQEGVSMVSVLPRRTDGLRASVLFGTLRYYWELILHRRRAPSVASNAWVINRDVLINKLGGFEPYKNYIQPEEKLAAKLMQNGLYRFLIGSDDLGVDYEKKWSSQVETSIRLLFPLFGGTVITNLLASICLMILNAPVVIILFGALGSWTLIQTVALWQLCVFVALYGLYLSRVWNKGWWAGALLWPVVVAQELIVHIVGIYRNIRQTVTWKDRPVMSKREHRTIERV